MTISRVIWCDRGWQPHCYGFCPDERAWNREMRRLKINDVSYPTSDACCTTFDKRKSHASCTIVTVSDAKRRPKLQVVGLLVHEAMHVWRRVREYMGESEPSLEFEAYAMQAISQNLIEAYEKTRGRLFRAR
jgi:hypothetical protein